MPGFALAQKRRQLSPELWVTVRQGHWVAWSRGLRGSGLLYQAWCAQERGSVSPEDSFTVTPSQTSPWPQALCLSWGDSLRVLMVLPGTPSAFLVTEG